MRVFCYCVSLTLLLASCSKPASSSDKQMASPYAGRLEVQEFIDKQVTENGADRAALVSVFQQIKADPKVLELISRAPESSITWDEYKDIFINDDRLQHGLRFYRKHARKIERAAKEYGISPAVIVAILGVETYYGKVIGSMKVVRSLATLSFDYPPRRFFFRRELAAFLQICSEQQLDPLEPEGSYAGAMGHPQFMPTSYIHYAVDFDQDGKVDIWQEPTDAIGSVANYLHEAGRWKPGRKMVERVFPSDTEGFSSSANQSVSAVFHRAELTKLGVTPTILVKDKDFILIWLEDTEGDGDEYWIGGKNFYAVTRYNSSYYYAMVVYLLAELIEQGIRK